MKKVNWNEFIGKKYNSLEIIGIEHIPDKHGDIKPYAKCKCDCGKETSLYIYNVVKGMSKTCGCGRKTAPDTEVGSVYGRLTVIAKDDTVNGIKRWKCRCSCGNEGVYTERSLRLHKRTTCGHCIPVAKPGERYGHLTVIEDLGTIYNSTGKCKIHGIKCKCDCGNETIVSNGILVAGRTISCGCMTALNPKDPRSDNPLINSLHGRAAMLLERCRNPYSDSFKNYGGRGIKCELGDSAWDVAESLSKIPGYFEGAQIDRIDNNGNYSMDNIRWVTSQENTNNSTIVISMSKEVLASRLLTILSAKKHMNRISKNISDFKVYKFNNIPCYEETDLVLCVYKDLSPFACISKIRKYYSEYGYDISDDDISRYYIK